MGTAITVFFVTKTPPTTTKESRAKSSDSTMIVENIKLAQLNDVTVSQSKTVSAIDRVVLSPAEKNILSTTDKRFSQDTLILLAEVNPPMWNNAKLQASDLFINQENAVKRIYVSYSMRGEPFIGAVQIIEIPTGLNVPKLLQTMIFTDFDIHSLTEKNGNLYLVGATSDAKFKTPAALEIIRLNNNGIIPLPLVSKRIDLPSFAAISVVKVRDQILVATGNKDGGIVEINNPESIADGFHYYMDLNHTVHDLDDARYLDYTDTHIYAVRGTDAALWVMDRASKTSQLIQLNGATIPESKSTVEISGDKILLALGDGGTQILDLQTLSPLENIPQAPHEDSSLSVTNAATGVFKEVFTADGEGGANIFQFSPDGKLSQVASMKFGTGKSVNAIKYFNSYLAMASGLGGVKIARLFRTEASIETAELTTYADYLKRRLADD